MRPRVQPGQWLALTAGNSTTATMVLQFAALRNVNVISMIRRAQNQIDLKAWGASEVIELANLAQTAGDRIMEITQGQGVNGVVDCVGGPVAGELIRSLSLLAASSSSMAVSTRKALSFTISTSS